MKIVLNPKYTELGPFVTGLPHTFHYADDCLTLHDGRNTIKLFTVNGQRIVVKSYGHLSLFNRLIYGILRKSKARRAYLHAGRLRNLGITTPEEIASIDIRHKGLLRENYFVSCYSDYLPLAPITETANPHPDARTVLDALTDFLIRLHQAGVMHKDLNIGNILYHQDENGDFDFSLIDTNRMSFHGKLSTRQRVKNLRRLSCAPLAYVYIIHRYAQKMGGDQTNAIQFKGILARMLFEAKGRLKRKIKRKMKHTH